MRVVLDVQMNKYLIRVAGLPQAHSELSEPQSTGAHRLDPAAPSHVPLFVPEKGETGTLLINEIKK